MYFRVFSWLYLHIVNDRTIAHLYLCDMNIYVQVSYVCRLQAIYCSLLTVGGLCTLGCTEVLGVGVTACSSTRHPISRSFSIDEHAKKFDEIQLLETKP